MALGGVVCGAFFLAWQARTILWLQWVGFLLRWLLLSQSVGCRVMGFSSCGLRAPQHVGYSQTKGWTSVPCIVRRILSQRSYHGSLGRDPQNNLCHWLLFFMFFIFHFFLHFIFLLKYSWFGFSRKEYWSGLPFPSPGDLPNSGIKPGSAALLADSLPTESLGKPY